MSQHEEGFWRRIVDFIMILGLHKVDFHIFDLLSFFIKIVLKRLFSGLIFSGIFSINLHTGIKKNIKSTEIQRNLYMGEVCKFLRNCQTIDHFYI